MIKIETEINGAKITIEASDAQQAAEVLGRLGLAMPRMNPVPYYPAYPEYPQPSPWWGIYPPLIYPQEWPKITWWGSDHNDNLRWYSDGTSVSAGVRINGLPD